MAAQPFSFSFKRRVQLILFNLVPVCVCKIKVEPTKHKIKMFSDASDLYLDMETVVVHKLHLLALFNVQPHCIIRSLLYLLKATI